MRLGRLVFALSVYVYIHISYMYTYLYMSMHTYMYIYIYMYMYRGLKNYEWQYHFELYLCQKELEVRSLRRGEPV